MNQPNSSTETTIQSNLRFKTVKVFIFIYAIAFLVDSAVQLFVPGQQVSGTPHVYFHILSGITMLIILKFFTSKIKQVLAIFGIGYIGLAIGASIFPHSHNGYASSIIGLDGDINTPLTHLGVGLVALLLLLGLHKTLPKK